MSDIAFLGLGAMGSRMAQHLESAGHPITKWKRGMGPAAEAVRTADIVFTMLTDDDACREVWLTHGVLSAMKPGALAVECSTVTPGFISELGHAADAKQVRLVEAPVAGSTPQADARQLAVLLGGAEEDIIRLTPFLTAFSSKQVHIGPRGHGATFKLIVNALFAVQVATMSELLALASTQGLDPTETLNRLSGLPVTSPAAEGVARLMLANDHAPRFPVDLVRKDLRYAVQAGAGEVVDAARAVFDVASAAGHGGKNLSAVGLR